MAILTRDKLFIFHLALSMVTFTMVLSSTVSDNWSTHKHGFHGVFKQCHLVHACNNRIQKTGLYRGLQLGLVLSCISLLLVVVYSFISLLLRQYLYNRVYVVAAFYAIPVLCISCVSPLYIILIHQKLNQQSPLNKEVPQTFQDLKIGWAFYIFAGALIPSVLGLACSFLIFGKERNRDVPLVRIDEKEMRHHVKSINKAKP